MSKAQAEAGLSIRLAVPADAEAMFALHRRSVLELCREAYTAHQLAAWFVERSPAIYGPALAAQRIHLGCRGDAIVGFVGFEPGEVTLLFVDPDASGAGVGQALFAFGLAAARAGHSGPLRVVATKNALRFYERRGFAETGRLMLERGDPVVLIEVVEMQQTAG